MRVLLLTGPVEGGIRKHVEALLGGLPAEGVESSLAGPSCLGISGVLCSQIPLTDRGRSALSPRNLLALRSSRRRARADLVHAHGYKAATLAGCAAVLPPGFPYLVTLHNLCPPLSAPSRLLFRFALGRARACLFVSEAVRESVAAAGIAISRGEVVPNGVEWQAFTALPDRDAARSALELTEAPVALFCGRLTEEKGVRVLAAAAAILREGGAAWQFLLAGEGPERSWLQSHPEARRGTLRLLGYREDLPTLLAACDVAVVPSLREGQSLAALEALAAGRPLVASDTGGLTDLARSSRAAWTVPPGDAVALADALTDLMSRSAEREERIARGLAHARTAGDERGMVRRVAGLYRELQAAP